MNSFDGVLLLLLKIDSYTMVGNCKPDGFFFLSPKPFRPVLLTFTRLLLFFSLVCSRRYFPTEARSVSQQGLR